MNNFYLSSTFFLLVNTHVHADHVTGSGKLKEKFPGCQSVISNDSGAKADFYKKTGETIQIGESGKTPLTLECRSTPGHTNGNFQVFLSRLLNIFRKRRRGVQKKVC